MKKDPLFFLSIHYHLTCAQIEIKCKKENNTRNIPQYNKVTHVMAHNQHAIICSGEMKKANETFEKQKLSRRKAHYSDSEQI